MGIAGKEIGSSIKVCCSACHLPVHVIVTTFEEDINYCPHCGGSFPCAELPEETADYADKIIRSEYKDSQEDSKPSPMLEHAILRAAKQRLSDLEVSAQKNYSFEYVQGRFSKLSGLTELAKLPYSGLSELTIKQLNEISAAASKVLHGVPR